MIDQTLWQFYEWVTSGLNSELCGISCPQSQTKGTFFFKDRTKKKKKPNPVTKQERGLWACQRYLWAQGRASQKLRCLIFPFPGGSGSPGKQRQIGSAGPPPYVRHPALSQEPRSGSSGLGTLALLDFPLFAPCMLTIIFIPDSFPSLSSVGGTKELRNQDGCSGGSKCTIKCVLCATGFLSQTSPKPWSSEQKSVSWFWGLFGKYHINIEWHFRAFYAQKLPLLSGIDDAILGPHQFISHKVQI